MKNNIAKSSLIVAIIGIISKLMGTFRTILVNAAFGQSALTDSYNTALDIALIGMILVNSTISLAIIPIMSKVKEEKGLKAKNNFFNNINTITFIINIVLTILTIVGAPLLVKIIAPGFTEVWQIDLTVKLIRIIAPSVILLGFVNCYGAYLQSNYSFGPFASIGIVNNIVFYIYLITIGKNATITELAIITTIANIVQAIYLRFFMMRQEIKIKPMVNIKDSYITESVILLIPLVLAQGITQGNYYVTNALASGLDQGTISTLKNANNLFSAIHSLFTTAFSQVVFPSISDAFSQKDKSKARNLIDEGLEVVNLFLIPATIGIIVLSTPIVRVVYEHGKFTPADTIVTKAALICYSIGMLGNGLKVYLNRVFYSKQDTLTPLKNQILTVIVNIALSFILIKPFGFKGLALSTSFAAIIGSTLLIISLKKIIEDMTFGKYIASFIKITIASLIMGAVVYIVNKNIILLLGDSKKIEFISLILSTIVGMIVYTIGIFVLKVESANLVLDKIKAKFKRN